MVGNILKKKFNILIVFITTIGFTSAVFFGVGLYLRSTIEVKDLYITNESSNGASIVFVTNRNTNSKVIARKVESTDKELVFYDDRDLVEVKQGEFKKEGNNSRRIHHISLRNLEPGTKYTFQVLVDGRKIDYEKKEFSTLALVNTLTVPDPFYGQVINTANENVEEGVVILQKTSTDGVSSFISGVVSKGGYSIDVGNMYKLDKSAPFNSPEYKQTLKVFGIEGVNVREFNAIIQKDMDQPVQTVNIGDSTSVTVLSEETCGNASGWNKEEYCKDSEGGACCKICIRKVTQLSNGEWCKEDDGGCKNTGDCKKPEEPKPEEPKPEEPKPVESKPPEQQPDPKPVEGGEDCNSVSKWTKEEYCEKEQDGACCKKCIREVAKIESTGEWCKKSTGDCKVTGHCQGFEDKPEPVDTTTPPAQGSQTGIPPAAAQPGTDAGTCGSNDNCSVGGRCGNLNDSPCSCGKSSISAGSSCSCRDYYKGDANIEAKCGGSGNVAQPVPNPAVPQPVVPGTDAGTCGANDNCSVGGRCGNLNDSPCSCGKSSIPAGSSCSCTDYYKGDAAAIKAKCGGGTTQPLPNNPNLPVVPPVSPVGDGGSCANDSCRPGERCGTLTRSLCGCGDSKINPGSTCSCRQYYKGDPNINTLCSNSSTTQPANQPNIPAVSLPTWVTDFWQLRVNNMQKPNDLVGNGNSNLPTNIAYKPTNPLSNSYFLDSNWKWGMDPKTKLANGMGNQNIANNGSTSYWVSNRVISSNTSNAWNVNLGNNQVGPVNKVMGPVENPNKTPSQEYQSSVYPLTPSVNDVAETVGIVDLNSVLDGGIKALDNTQLSDQEKGVCLNNLVNSQPLVKICEDALSEMSLADAEFVTDLVNVVSSGSEIAKLSKRAGKEIGAFKELGEIVGMAYNPVGNASEEVRQSLIEDIGVPITLGKWLNLETMMTEPALMIGDAGFGDNQFISQAYTLNMFREVESEEAIKIINWVENLSGQDIDFPVEDEQKLEELRAAIGDVNKRGGFVPTVIDGDSFVFSLDRNNYSPEVLQVLDSVSESVNEAFKANPEEINDLSVEQQKLLVYSMLDQENFITAVETFDKIAIKNLIEFVTKGKLDPAEIPEYIKNAKNGLPPVANTFSEEDSVEQIDEVGIVQVFSEPTTLEPGVYEVNNDDITTKEISIVEGKGITYFFDKNKNGIKEDSEPYYFGSIYSLDVKFKKLMDVQTYKLKQGWNLIAMPMLMRGEETSQIQKASEFLAKLNSNGAGVTHISTYRANQFILYSAREDAEGVVSFYGEDFNILPGEAYYVKSLADNTITLKGNKVEGSQEILIGNGWNLVNIYNSEKESYKGFDVLRALNQGNISSDTMSDYQDGMYRNIVIKDSIEYGNDFTVYPYSGYWLRVQDKGTGRFKPN